MAIWAASRMGGQVRGNLADSERLPTWLDALAGRSDLVLVKSAVLAPDSLDADVLARKGIVDRLFLDYVLISGASIYLLSIQDPLGLDRLRWLLSGSRFRPF